MFNLDKSSRDGRQPKCKTCSKRLSSKARAKAREKELAAKAIPIPGPAPIDLDPNVIDIDPYHPTPSDDPSPSDDDDPDPDGPVEVPVDIDVVPGVVVDPVVIIQPDPNDPITGGGADIHISFLPPEIGEDPSIQKLFGPPTPSVPAGLDLNRTFTQKDLVIARSIALGDDVWIDETALQLAKGTAYTLADIQAEVQRSVAAREEKRRARAELQETKADAGLLQSGFGTLVSHPSGKPPEEERGFVEAIEQEDKRLLEFLDLTPDFKDLATEIRNGAVLPNSVSYRNPLDPFDPKSCGLCTDDKPCNSATCPDDHEARAAEREEEKNLSWAHREQELQEAAQRCIDHQEKLKVVAAELEAKRVEAIRVAAIEAVRVVQEREMIVAHQQALLDQARAVPPPPRPAPNRWQLQETLRAAKAKSKAVNDEIEHRMDTGESVEEFFDFDRATRVTPPPITIPPATIIKPDLKPMVAPRKGFIKNVRTFPYTPNNGPKIFGKDNNTVKKGKI